jgi:hypothetical protein
MNRTLGRTLPALLLVFCCPARAETEVYTTNFTDGPDARWSSDATFELPANQDKCLGRFTNDSITLKLTDLPDHAYIQVQFDLLLLRTWDGNKADIGPDRWSFRTDDGRVWVDHTFANTNHDQDQAIQSFPGTLVGESSPPTTGAAGTNNIGGFDMSSTYRMRFVIPHRKDAITLLFAGRGLQDVNNECWCLDNVKVTALQSGDVAAADDEQLQRLISQLREERPMTAWKAMSQAVAQGDRFTAFVQSHRNGDFGIGDNKSKQEQISRWIEQLDHDSFAEREAATKKLVANLGAARPMIRELLTSKQASPEQRWRLKRILTDTEAPPVADPDRRLELRLLRTLELIGTAEATAVHARILGQDRPKQQQQ